MKTFQQFVEQIPSAPQTSLTMFRTRQNEIAKRQLRRQVHGELERRAEHELSNVEKTKAI